MSQFLTIKTKFEVVNMVVMVAEGLSISSSKLGKAKTASQVNLYAAQEKEINLLNGFCKLLGLCFANSKQ